MQQVLTGGPPLSINAARPRKGSRRSTDSRWAIAFIAPYAAVFFFFIVYPFAYALWMARDPALYAELIGDPLYLPSVVNTVLFVGFGVNLKMFLALLLSGFFLRPRWWIKALLVVFVLPWLIATAEACVSFHWLLTGRWGLIDSLLSAAFGIDGPNWLNSRWPALGSDTAAYIWKWLPFWTVIFIAGRLTIPRDIYDAAAIDGATAIRRFFHVTFPMLANLYVICTLLSVLWTLGDFTTVYLVSSGGPADSTQVLATLGFQYAFDAYKPALGVAAVMSALPVLIPIVILLMRRLRASEVQL
ncbi:MAG TPA: sugar ABC transporter permease [Stellaceae bacterium]|nr:sugar ABC transporter permease [Stellaceae bacterium]